MEKDVALVSWSTGKTESMKVFGPTISEKEKDMKDIQTATDTKEIFKKEKLTAKVYTIGPMEKSMMASGRMESKMVTACGEAFSGTLIWASGRTLRLMDTAYINGRMETDTKAPGSIA